MSHGVERGEVIVVVVGVFTNVFILCMAFFYGGIMDEMAKMIALLFEHLHHRW